ncbi:MAG: MFS transporter [Anaerolineae bacterium]|nr:MFS transporter [Anaerolineae bacterium]
MIWGLYILIQIANSMVFVLLGVYVKENYAISENRFGLIIGVNALMVVFFQYAVTRISTRHAPLHAITAGAVFQAVGLGVFAISQGFAAFLGGMVVFTVGELLLVPTATALVANIAPPHMRARYMGVFSLSFRVGSGIGPVVGGLLNDNIAPVATWYGAMVFCGIAVAGFGLLSRRAARPAVQQAGSPL